MFDFEKLKVYSKAKAANRAIRHFTEENPGLNKIVTRQLSRASHSVVLNIAEGTSRMTNPSKRNFYIISRGSAFECVAILDELHDDKLIAKNQYQEFYFKFEEISKMLFSMIKGLE